MTIGTLYRMFNNLNNLTYVKVNEIKESEAAANKMQRRYKNCVGYVITRL